METIQNQTNSQPPPPREKPHGLSLHAKMFFGLLFGAIAGLTANLLFADHPSLEWAVKNLTEPVGQIFLRLMTMVVVPLVFCSLTLGVASLGDLRKLGRIGVKTLFLFLLTTAFASGIGLFMVNMAKPGVGLSEDVKTRLMQIYSEDAKKSIVQATENKQISGFSLRWLLPLIPKNPLASAVQADMLPVIFFSLVLGMALTRMPLSRSQGFVAFLSGLGEAMVVIIDFALALAPYGVGALIFSVTARFGFSLLGKLAWFVFTVLFGLLFHQFVVLSAFIYFGAGVNLIAFYQAIKVVMLTAFSTSSSNATLPTTMRQGEEELGIPKDICGFVLPLGATVNMNGTALFEGVTVLFLAQVFGVQLSISSQLFVLGFCVISAIGAAGVPGGSIPLLIVILQSVGIPGEGIAIILGVDRFLDMCRTVLNVSGDLVTAAIVARSEGFQVLSKVTKPAPIGVYE